MTGQTSYHAGLAAEDIVSRHYTALGFSELDRRWRGPGGEIDLILHGHDITVFVEVKKSRDFAAASHRVTPRQIGRILNSAVAYMAGLTHGQDSESRVDVALVDATGRVEVIENITMQ